MAAEKRMFPSSCFLPQHPRRHRRRLLRRRWCSRCATRGRTSCSSTGTKRTLPPKPSAFSTTRSVPMATAPTCRSSSQATPTVRVRRATTWVWPSAAAVRFVGTSRPTECPMAASRARRSARPARAWRPPTRCASSRTVASRSPTVPASTIRAKFDLQLRAC